MNIASHPTRNPGKPAEAPRHPWTRNTSPLMPTTDRFRPTIIENVGGCAKRITVRWDLRCLRHPRPGQHCQCGTTDGGQRSLESVSSFLR